MEGRNFVRSLLIISHIDYDEQRDPRNPTNAVGGSFILSLQRRAPGPVPNPTNAVGGSFILSLQRRALGPRPESHQRSWWTVHTQPTEALAGPPSRIPPTKMA